MKILLSADPELPVPPELYGGIERIVDGLARGLQSRGHRVGLVAHPRSTAPVDSLFPWPGHGSRGVRYGVQNAMALWRAVRTFEPDVIHSFSRLLYLLPLARSSIPRIMSYQRPPNRRTVGGSARVSKGLVFTGCSEYIASRGRRIAGEWYPVHNFVDPDTYTFRPRVDDDAPLVFLGRVERIKGVHTAIAAARRTGRRLVIAGPHHVEGEAGRYWRDEIEPFIAEGGIDYVGPVNDAQKNEILGGAAALISPIEWDEPFGIVFIEALACGTPVISSPRGALPEIVRNGREGFLVTSVGEACEAIDRLDGLDRSACRMRVVECFSRDVVVGLYEKLYAALAEGVVPDVRVS